MWRMAVALVCVGSAALGMGCGHAARGAVATRPPPATGEASVCDDGSAPYLAELCAMGEPSLAVAGPETYRFVRTRHLGNPVAVRLRLVSDGVDVVAIEADERDPANKRRHEFKVAGEAWMTLLMHLQAADFWNLPGDPTDDERGLDGADWILEGRRGGLYHSVIRWEPRPGPFRAACEDFIKVSGLSLGAEIH